MNKLVRMLFCTLIIGIFSIDLTAQTWNERAPIPTMRWNPTSVTIGHLIYVVGGQDNSGTAIGVVEAYNTVTDTCATLAEMPTERWSLMVSVWHGKIFAIGGQGGSFPGTSTNPAEAYDPLTNSWSSVAALADPCGSVLIKCLSDAEPDGWGPYRIDRDDIQNMFAASFSVVAVVETVYQGRFDHLDGRDPAAYFVELESSNPQQRVARRRGKPRARTRVL